VAIKAAVVFGVDEAQRLSGAGVLLDRIVIGQHDQTRLDGPGYGHLLELGGNPLRGF
jgi:hypothetical protein